MRKKTDYLEGYTQMTNGFIKIYRQIRNWGWYSDTVTTRVWLHCLVMANWRDKEFRGELIPRGSFITSQEHLCKELGLTRAEVRTALNHLNSTNEITITTTKKWTVIKVEKYDDFQVDESQNNQVNNQVINQQPTNKQPSVNQQTTITKEYKNIRNKEYQEFKYLSKEKIEQLKENNNYMSLQGLSEEEIEEYGHYLRDVIIGHKD